MRSKNVNQLQNHYFLLSQIIAFSFSTCGRTLVKIWKTKISVKFLILQLLLQISYIFIAPTKDLSELQISPEN